MDVSVWVPAATAIVVALITVTPPALKMWQSRRRTKSETDPPREVAGATGRRHRRGRSRPLLPESVRQFVLDQRDEGGYIYHSDSLRQLYVVPELEQSRDRDSEDGDETTDPPRRTTIEALLTDPEPLHLVVTGEAGLGKSSLLTHVATGAWQHWQRLTGKAKQEDFPLGGLVPIQIAARHLIGRTSVAAALGPKTEALLREPPVAGARWLVMIDALDEITDNDDRADVERLICKALEQAQSREAPCRYLITARGLGDQFWRALNGLGATEFRLRPFTAEMLREYLVNHRAGHRSRLADPQIKHTVEAEADRFLARMDDAGDLLELLKLPLLAHVTATIYFAENQDSELPARRVDIYRDTVDHWLSQFELRLAGAQSESRARELVRKWGAARNGSESEAELLRAFLAELADRHLSDDRRAIGNIACEMLGAKAVPKSSADWKAVATLLNATGLIHDLETKEPRFLHRTFAEYLAAPLRTERFADPRAWAAALVEEETRPAAVFAFEQLRFEQRRELTEELVAHQWTVVAAGWLVAEGLCTANESTHEPDTDMRDRIIDRLVEWMPHRISYEWSTVLSALVASPRLRHAIHDIAASPLSDSSKRVTLSECLATQDPRGPDLLRAIANDRQIPDHIRTEAALSLSLLDLGEARELWRLQANDHSASSSERLLAASSLVSFGFEEGIGVMRLLAIDSETPPEDRTRAAGELVGHDATTAHDVALSLALDTSVDFESRSSSAYILARLEYPNGVQMLVDFATAPDRNAVERTSAAGKLIGVDPNRGAELLRRMITEPDCDSEAPYIARLLSLLDQKEGEDLLASIAESEQSNIGQRLLAAIDLARLNPVRAADALKNLVSMARSPDSSGAIHSIAISTLVRCDPDTGYRLVRTIAENAEAEHSERVRMASTLANSDPVRAGALLKDLGGDQAAPLPSRCEAFEYLAEIDRTVGLAGFCSLAEDPSIPLKYRIPAIEGLAKFDPQAAAAVCRRYIDDPECEPSDRVSAAGSLAKWAPAEGVPILEHFVSDAGLLEQDRTKACLKLLSAAPRVGRDRAVEICSDPNVSAEMRTRTALYLAYFDLAKGLEFLRAFVTDSDFPDSARYMAVRELSSRTSGSELMHQILLDDPDLDSKLKQAIREHYEAVDTTPPSESDTA